MATEPTQIRPEVVAANLLLLMAGKQRDPLFEAVVGGAIIAINHLTEAKNEENQPSVDQEGMGTVPNGPGEVSPRHPEATEGLESTG